MPLASAAARKRRQRLRNLGWMIVKVGSAVIILAFTAFSAFEVGMAKTDAEKNILEDELRVVKDRDLTLARAKAEAEEKARRMGAALARLEADYAANVPQGAVRKLVTEVRDRLQAGVPADRLAFLLRNATVEPVCEETVETKRLHARTPIASDVRNTVSFAGGRISLSGEGEPSHDEAGRPEAWFDPALPVALHFLTISGTAESIEIVLPVAHALIFGGHEYRIQAAASNRRGYIEVAVQVCDYP